MRLSVLAGAIGVPFSGEDREVTGIALDSRQVQPGQLFVAIAGANAATWTVGGTAQDPI